VVLLVVDENSMVDLMLMQALLKAALLIVGSGAVPVRLVRLAEVFRQTAESKTITTAPAISASRLPYLAPPSEEAYHPLRATSALEHAVSRIDEMVSNRAWSRFGFEVIQDIQTLYLMNRAAFEFGLSASSCGPQLNLAG
jgi:exodeoxyribonuclease V alpha subunit